MERMSVKVYLQLNAPTEEDFRSSAQRIGDALQENYGDVGVPVRTLRKLYPMCQKADWKITATLAWDGKGWQLVNVEPGDTTGKNIGLAVDLGSTTVVMEAVDLISGKVLAAKTQVNRQVEFGNEILSRIFSSHENPEVLERIRLATVSTIQSLMDDLSEELGYDLRSSGMLVVSGNTTMMHFLLGLDAFTVFMSPYATVTTEPGFLPAQDLGLEMAGMVYIVPSKSNYVGGDITSGAVALGLTRSEEINIFLDIGTNGELLMGNRDFMVAGAGAAGPALEGEVIRTGMRAEPGAVDSVKIRGDRVELTTIGNAAPKGICGSGIADLLAELYLENILDFRGKFIPENSGRMERIEGEWAYRYADGLYFYQSDIDQFIATKAAAYTMVEYMMQKIGLSMEEVSKFYLAGAFGTHIKIESGVTIGLYPDIPRERIISAGNSSLLGARAILLDRERLAEVRHFVENTDYIQFGEVANFVDIMSAAQGIPHLDVSRYPSVIKWKENRKSLPLEGKGECVSGV